MKNIFYLILILIFCIIGQILYNNKEYFCDKCIYSRPTKCFSCEKELPPQYKYLAYPTKCFSCERQELQMNSFN